MSEMLCKYSKFWIRFQKIITTQLPNACQCFPKGDLWREKLSRGIGNTYRMALKEPILLRNLQCQSISGHLDVIIDYEERFSNSKFDIPIGASISVHYFLRKKGDNHSATRLHSLRFDFHPDVGGKDGDPITHAHIESKPPRKIPESYRNMKLNNSSLYDKETFVVMSYGRMPTPRLPLPGVLCLLVADHYRGGVRTLIEETQGILTSFSPSSTYSTWHKNADFTKRSDAMGWAWYTY